MRKAGSMRDGLEAAAADFAAAPFDPGRWDAALDGLARAGGGWAGQLAATSPTQGFVLDLQPRLPPDLMQEFQAWGVDPMLQPRAAVLDKPLMQVVADFDVIGPSDRDRDPFYGFLKRFDGSYCCMSRIDVVDGLSIVATATRHERAGHVEPAERDAFAALLPHVRAAARLQLRLEAQGARLAMGMMGAVGQAAAVCDARGRIVAATPAAEAALQAGAFVTLRRGRLASPDPASDTALMAAVARAGAPATLEQPAASRVRLHDAQRRRWIVAETAPVPPELAAFRVQAAVMVLLQLDPPAEAQAARLMRLYSLTAVEAQVALAIARGDAAGAIAERRGVRITTVRSQLAAILAKTGTTHQTELVALIARTVG